jgi:hypothetical protein
MLASKYILCRMTHTNSANLLVVLAFVRFVSSDGLSWGTTCYTEDEILRAVACGYDCQSIRIEAR